MKTKYSAHRFYSSIQSNDTVMYYLLKRFILFAGKSEIEWERERDREKFLNLSSIFHVSLKADETEGMTSDNSDNNNNTGNSNVKHANHTCVISKQFYECRFIAAKQMGILQLNAGHQKHTFFTYNRNVVRWKKIYNSVCYLNKVKKNKKSNWIKMFMFWLHFSCCFNFFLFFSCLLLLSLFI